MTEEQPLDCRWAERQIRALDVAIRSLTVNPNDGDWILAHKILDGYGWPRLADLVIEALEALDRPALRNARRERAAKRILQTRNALDTLLDNY